VKIPGWTRAYTLAPAFDQQLPLFRRKRQSAEIGTVAAAATSSPGKSEPTPTGGGAVGVSGTLRQSKIREDKN
jgi:hypothetical protein